MTRRTIHTHRQSEPLTIERGGIGQYRRGVWVPASGPRDMETTRGVVVPSFRRNSAENQAVRELQLPEGLRTEDVLYFMLPVAVETTNETTGREADQIVRNGTEKYNAVAVTSWGVRGDEIWQVAGARVQAQ